MMATIKLKVSDKILDKVIWLLGQFSPNDLQIIEGDTEYGANKTYLQEELARYETGEAGSISLEDLDKLLEDQIRKHEN